MANLATKFRIRASVNLRDTISADDDATLTTKYSPKVWGQDLRRRFCWSIYLLAVAEQDARNFLEAKTHGRILRQLLQPEDPADRVLLEPLQLLSIFCSDTNRASLSLTRPSFDIDRWKEENCPEPVQLPSFHLRPVDSSLTDPGIRRILLDLRHCMAAIQYYWPLDEQPLELYTRLIYMSRFQLGRLVDSHLDGDGRPSCLASAGATYLACVYWLRRANRWESLGIDSKLAKLGSTLYDSGPKILHELKIIAAREKFGLNPHYICIDSNCVGSSDSRCSGPVNVPISTHDQDSTSRWRLWILYIGALIERAPHSRLMRLGTSFQAAFILEAKVMGYPSWQAVRDSLLKDFLYDEGMDPEADQWFADAMTLNFFREYSSNMKICQQMSKRSKVAGEHRAEIQKGQRNWLVSSHARILSDQIEQSNWNHESGDGES